MDARRTDHIARDRCRRSLAPFSTVPSWDSTTRAITWAETARGTNPTYVAAKLSSANTLVDIRAPYETGRLTIPVLPTFANLDLNPTASTSFTLFMQSSPLPWSAFSS